MSYGLIACLVFMTGVGLHSYRRVERSTCVILVLLSPLPFFPLASLCLSALVFVAQQFAVFEVFHPSEEMLGDVLGLALIAEAFVGTMLFGKIIRARGAPYSAPSNLGAEKKKEPNQPP